MNDELIMSATTNKQIYFHLKWIGWLIESNNEWKWVIAFAIYSSINQLKLFYWKEINLLHCWKRKRKGKQCSEINSFLNPPINFITSPQVIEN